jgi:ABC-2 type transport system ATP-binding protein
MNADVSVRAEALSRRFGSFVAVDAVSFDIGAGQIWGFLGPNGSGKSTTIRMLCGVLAPTSGRALVLGYDIARDPEAVKLRIGYVSQGASLWNDLTVEEHLRLYAGLYGLSGQAERAAIEEWLVRVGLTDDRRQLAAELPGGARKRVALACALLHRPHVLFLDEPTSGVDPVARREFWDLIVGLADDGTTVMVTTHYLDEAEHCDQLAFIYRGRIIARGSPEALKHDGGIGVTVEIVSDRNVALLEPIERIPFVRSVALYGSSLHVTVDSERELDRLRTELDPLGAPAFARVVPSLEDVFAEIMRRTDRGEQ